MTLLLIFVSIAYVVLLFGIARWGDKHGQNSESLARHPAVYALALGIYCTSWTYFGAVGTASQNGWSFMPIYLGPILLLTLGFPMLRKLVEVSKKQNITSIADFVASRYGKRQNMALIVTLLMTLAAIPYIALQLKAINTSFETIAELTSSGWSSTYEGVIASVLLAVFVILFGVKKADVTEYRSGLILAVAAESLVKLIGLACAGLIAYSLLPNDINQDYELMQAEQIWSFNQFVEFEFIVQTLMAAAAFLCLPRQFHVMVVDNAKLSDLNTARWLSPVYLALMALMIIPISIVGNGLLGSGINPDTLTLYLPLHIDSNVFTAIVFIGGLSAATAMIIVATLTLGTMWTNEVIMPYFLKRDVRQIISDKKYHQRIMSIRRFSITAILALAYIYYQSLTQQAALHGIGLIAFSLVIQILPAIVGGLYWKSGHASGVYAGLLSGFVCWLLFLLMPLAIAEQVEVSQIISHGVVISLAVNILNYLLFSKLADERLMDKIQASAFINLQHDVSKSIYGSIRAKNQDMLDLLETFIGRQRREQIITQFQTSNDVVIDADEQVNQNFAEYCERQLAGVLGSSSATSIINIVLSGKRLDLGEVVHIFDDTTKALQTNQAILFNSLESLSQGISIVDRELNLVAWNKAYLSLFKYPEGMVETGKPVAELIRYNAERGECGQGTVEEHIEKRLQFMRSGSPHSFIRRRSDGRIIEMVGSPLPNGGFITSFTDITKHVESQKALQESNVDLEEHVKDQMAKISEISAELKSAKLLAETANNTKTRFLALASHDILQPLNAARLYLSSLNESPLEKDQQLIVSKVDTSLQATEDLISTLLEISRLDQGALEPSISHFHLSDVLSPLLDQFSQQANEKSLKFNAKWQDYPVVSDKTYLRRIIQNLISNAIKYTQTGKVLVCIRPLNHQLRIQVWDTGVGLTETEQQRIFADFHRAQPEMATGVGLGLGVVVRMSEQLSAPITVRSNYGKGSCFTVSIPIGNESRVISQQEAIAETIESFNIATVWCIDDNSENLDALNSLLHRWKLKVTCISSVSQAIEIAEASAAPDALLVDYQLEPAATNGIELINHLRTHWKKSIPASLITAVKSDELKTTCKAVKVNYMSKPLKPARLKSWLKSI